MRSAHREFIQGLSWSPKIAAYRGVAEDPDIAALRRAGALKFWWRLGSLLLTPIPTIKARYPHEQFAPNDHLTPEYAREPFHRMPGGYANSAVPAFELMYDLVFGGRGHLERMRNAVVEEFNVGDRLVDLGCGTCPYTKHVLSKRLEYSGVDLSETSLAYAQLHAEAAGAKPLHLLRENIEATSLPSQSADAVLLSFILHEMPPSAIRNTLRESARLLDEGGKLVILEVRPESMTHRFFYWWYRTLVYEPHAHHLVHLDLDAEARAAGLEFESKRFVRWGTAVQVYRKVRRASEASARQHPHA